MAFTATIVGTGQNLGTARRMVWGTIANTSGSTGGVIHTGLVTVESIVAPSLTSASYSGGDATIVQAANAGGGFIAIGL